MESAHQRMDGSVLDASLDVLERIHDPRVTTTQQHNMAAFGEYREALTIGDVILDPLVVYRISPRASSSFSTVRSIFCSLSRPKRPSRNV